MGSNFWLGDRGPEVVYLICEVSLKDPSLSGCWDDLGVMAEGHGTMPVVRAAAAVFIAMGPRWGKPSHRR